jgi:ferredoxin
MRIVLDADVCTGHGRCYSLAPDVFDADDLGHCVVLVAEPSAEQEVRARTAVASCPEVALSIEE